MNPSSTVCVPKCGSADVRERAILRLAVGGVARLVVLAAVALIVGDAVVTLWERGD